jgi:hypothetical protein
VADRKTITAAQYASVVKYAEDHSRKDTQDHFPAIGRGVQKIITAVGFGNIGADVRKRDRELVSMWLEKGGAKDTEPWKKAKSNGGARRRAPEKETVSA